MHLRKISSALHVALESLSFNNVRLSTVETAELNQQEQRQWRRRERFIQLFRERLSGKVLATILKGIMGGFEFPFFQRNLKELVREAMEMCLRELKESNKNRFDSYSVRNSVLIISHITFRDCRVHSFSDNLSRNSCI